MVSFKLNLTDISLILHVRLFTLMIFLKAIHQEGLPFSCLPSNQPIGVVALEDNHQEPEIQAVFSSEARGTCYHNNGHIWWDRLWNHS